MTGKPASAFAPQQTAKGKTISWEYILNVSAPANFNTVFPTLVRAVGAFDTRFVTLIPVNVVRGTVTLERVRGHVEVYFSSLELAASFTNWAVHIQMQLVSIRNGVIDTSSILGPDNSADQESNKIIWQRTYLPRAGTTITAPGAVELHESNYIGMEVDIKVKRRFDRATWALILVAEAESNSLPLHFVSAQMRALFRTGDGI